MFVNAAPSVVGLGMAGTGFVSNELADLVGRENTLGRYLSKVNELANQGLSNFAYAPSITNKALRAVLQFKTLLRLVKGLLIGLPKVQTGHY